MTKNDLLSVKKTAKAKRPAFVRTDAHKKVRVKKSWRKPNGIQNKMRLHQRSYRVMVEAGYGSPAALRGMNDAGLRVVRVSTLAELSALDPKKDAALLANVGRRKKEELIKAAQARKISLANLAVEKYQAKTASLLKERAAKKDAAETAAKAKAAKKDKKKEAVQADEPEASADSSEDEERKEQEKREKDKVLTSKKGF